MRRLSTTLMFSCVILTQMFSTAHGDDTAPGTKPQSDIAKPVPLNTKQTVFLDKANKKLILKGELVLREGPLEMFLCKAQTKEHESITAVDSDAYVIHAGLLALGAKSGTPAQYEPEFKPPTGQPIQIFVSWKDKGGKQKRVKAQSLIRRAIHRYHSVKLDNMPELELPEDSEIRYDKFNKEILWFGPMTKAQRDTHLKLSKDEKYQAAIKKFYEDTIFRPLEATWVFAGSGFYEQENGEKYYQAEAGNVVCVANFGDAMIDLSIESSATNAGLMYEAWTERLPKLGTKVEIELVPVFEKEDGESKPSD